MTPQNPHFKVRSTPHSTQSGIWVRKAHSWHLTHTRRTRQQALCDRHRVHLCCSAHASHNVHNRQLHPHNLSVLAGTACSACTAPLNTCCPTQAPSQQRTNPSTPAAPQVKQHSAPPAKKPTEQSLNTPALMLSLFLPSHTSTTQSSECCETAFVTKPTCAWLQP